MSRGLHQERWRKDLKRVIFIGGNNFAHLWMQRNLNCEINCHTLVRQFSDLWQVSQGVENCCNSSPHLVTVLHTLWHLSKITEPPDQGVKINFTVQVLWSISVKIISPYKYHPLQVFSSSLLMKTSVFEVMKLVELNFLVSLILMIRVKLTLLTQQNVITYNDINLLATLLSSSLLLKE